MGAHSLVIDEAREFSARVSLVAADDAQLKRLRRSPSAFSHVSDPIRCVSRSAARSEDRVGGLWQSRGALLLLANNSFSHSLRARVVASPVGLFGAVSVSDEHGQGTALRDHLPRPRDLFFLSPEILAAVADRAVVHVDLRPVSAARDGGCVLVGGDRLDRTSV